MSRPRRRRGLGWIPVLRTPLMRKRKFQNRKELREELGEHPRHICGLTIVPMIRKNGGFFIDDTVTPRCPARPQQARWQTHVHDRDQPLRWGLLSQKWVLVRKQTPAPNRGCPVHRPTCR